MFEKSAIPGGATDPAIKREYFSLCVRFDLSSSELRINLFLKFFIVNWNEESTGNVAAVISEWKDVFKIGVDAGDGKVRICIQSYLVISNSLIIPHF